MKHTLAALAALGLSIGAAYADDVTGVWKTEANDEGNYLEVDFAPCGDAMCGTIVAARNVSGSSDENYEHLGKPMVTGMVPDGKNEWTDGEIWDPSEDKRYDSNMELKGDTLVVEGCILFFCRGQDWTRVN
ncbi:MAG: DUF2147 domain-containing protein [Pikeienuella sp.]